MNYLLINTANEELVIVLFKDGEIFACNETMVKKHNEVLLPKLQEVLDKSNLTLKDIDEYGVVVGPGSFTGLRVGIATVKAFKDVFNKPVRAINNLDLLYQISSKSTQCKVVAIEGSLNSYFVGKYENGQLNIYERNLSQDELLQVASGEKVAMYSNSHNFELGEVVTFDNDAFVQTFLNSNIYNLTPIYYQLSQAENDKIAHAKLIIREAEVYDLKVILELCKNNFDEYSLDLLETNLLNKNHITYVAQIDDQVVGFVLVDKTDINNEVFISAIVVDVNFRNHGIGTQLIQMVESLAKEVKSQVCLLTLEKHFTIRTLCQKLNYQINNAKIFEKYNKNNYKYLILKSFK